MERIQFSPGGLEARYGDKMSSVLDIQYKRAARICGQGATIGLLRRYPYRRRHVRQAAPPHHGFPLPEQHACIERSRIMKGEYRPAYTDPQTYWTYDLSEKVELGFLGLYSTNKHGVVPEDRERNSAVSTSLRLHLLLRRSRGHQIPDNALGIERERAANEEPATKIHSQCLQHAGK
ncbi:MAG: hypothetical protein IPO87_19200 [Flavobacteriales bacterium]|nr:hypothetical protein [Flavobacteriales bacterium]